MMLAIGTPFIPGWQELKPFIAEVWIVLTILAVLLAPFFTRRSNFTCAAVAVAGLTIALISLLAVTFFGDDPFGFRFTGLVVNDPFAVFLKVLLILFVLGIVLLWFCTTARTFQEGDAAEFLTLLLGATLGMCLMVSTTNLLMLVLSVEMASLPSYVMAGFRKTHRRGAEASLKYVLFGAASSAIMIYGLSLLYGTYGTLQIDDFRGAHGLASLIASGQRPAVLLVISLGGLLVGLGFKIAAVPFHFWCPDVFEGASIDVSAFLSVASKGTGLALLLRVLMLIADAAGYHDQPHLSLSAIAAIVGVLGAVTVTVGNTAAFVQNNIKRLLAYSSIAHAGYMLCALSLLVSHDAAQISPDGQNLPAQSLLVYLAVYLFMNLGAFAVAGMVWRHTGSEQIIDFAGLGRRSPMLAACMACCLISLIGLPPFAGFIAKFNLMYVLGRNGGGWWGLVAVVGINTVVSLFYYARLLKVMYLSDNQQPIFDPPPIGLAVAVASSAMLVLMLFAFNPLLRLTGVCSRMHSIGKPSPVALAPSAP